MIGGKIMAAASALYMYGHTNMLTLIRINTKIVLALFQYMWIP